MLLVLLRSLDFCYLCGKLDHQDVDCDISVSLQKENQKPLHEYGSWMRAEGPRFSAVKFEERGIKSQSNASSSKTLNEDRSVHPPYNQLRDFAVESTAESGEPNVADDGVKGKKTRVCKKDYC